MKKEYLEDIFPDKNVDTPYLERQDLENMLTVHTDKHGNYIFNLNEAIYVTISRDNLSYFTLTHPMHWPIISYVIYNTTRLAWLLMLVNDVKLDNAFDAVQPGVSILYPTSNAVSQIVSVINTNGRK